MTVYCCSISSQAFPTVIRLNDTHCPRVQGLVQEPAAGAAEVRHGVMAVLEIKGKGRRDEALPDRM